MAYTLRVTDSTGWRNVSQVWVKDSTGWREVTKAWVKDSTGWRLVFVFSGTETLTTGALGGIVPPSWTSTITVTALTQGGGGGKGGNKAPGGPTLTGEAGSAGKGWTVTAGSGNVATFTGGGGGGGFVNQPPSGGYDGSDGADGDTTVSGDFSVTSSAARADTGGQGGNHDHLGSNGSGTYHAGGEGGDGVTGVAAITWDGTSTITVAVNGSDGAGGDSQTPSGYDNDYDENGVSGTGSTTTVTITYSN